MVKQSDVHKVQSLPLALDDYAVSDIEAFGRSAEIEGFEERPPIIALTSDASPAGRSSAATAIRLLFASALYRHPDPFLLLPLDSSSRGLQVTMAEFVRAQIFGTTFEITSRSLSPTLATFEHLRILTGG